MEKEEFLLEHILKTLESIDKNLADLRNMCMADYYAMISQPQQEEKPKKELKAIGMY